MTTPATAKLVLYHQSANTFVVRKAFRTDAGEFLNSATVTATLIDPDGDNVPGLISLSMTYITGSNGTYKVVFPRASMPHAGDEYTVRCRIVSGNYDRTFDIAAEVVDGAEPKLVLNQAGDNTIAIRNLFQTFDDEFDPAATITLTLFYANGSQVDDIIDLPATYVAGSNGTFQVVIPSSVMPVAADGYSTVITAESGSYDRIFTIPTEVV
jgi:hypothetical protein